MCSAGIELRREGGREERREGEKERGREERREGGREGGMRKSTALRYILLHFFNFFLYIPHFNKSAGENVGNLKHKQ